MKFPELHNFEKSPKMANNKNCWEELEEKHVQQNIDFEYLAHHYLYLQHTAAENSVAENTLLHTYRIFQQTPAPMTNFLKNKEKYSIYWQYKRGLELTS